MRDDGERVTDILDAAEKIRRKVAEGRDAFDADEYAQLAIVHLIQIIGEAANRLSPELTDAHPEIPWRQTSQPATAWCTAISTSTSTCCGPSRPSTSRNSRRNSARSRQGSFTEGVQARSR